MGKREYCKERYDWLKSSGICVCCGQQEAFNGSILCPDCWEKKELCRKPLTEDERKKKLECQRLLRQTRINLNQCVDCGEGLGERKATRCERCAKRHRKRTKPYAMTREQAIYRGICVQCKKNKVVENRTICASCLEAGRKQIEMMNQRRKMKRYENNKKIN